MINSVTASLERHAAEASLQPPVAGPDAGYWTLYMQIWDASLRRVSNCLDWLGSMGHRQTRLSCREGDPAVDKVIQTICEIARL